MQVRPIALLERFTCLQEHCPDTCCRHWSMQLDDPTFALYQQKAPELLSAVAQEEDGLRVMRREGAAQECVKLEGGLCGIHKSHGAGMLGDACYFYPRITRSLGKKTIMSATLSCPEVVRLALENADSAYIADVAVELGRLPHTVKDYLPEGLQAEDALALHRFFVQAVQNESLTAQQLVLKLHSVALSLSRIPVAQWLAATQTFWELSDSSMPKPQAMPEDALYLVQALCGLAAATRKPLTPAFIEITDSMQQALCMHIEWDTMSVHVSDEAGEAIHKVSAAWSALEPLMAQHLRRWLAMQLSAGLFPFAGLGESPAERIMIIGVRLATLKLALQCYMVTNGAAPDNDAIIKIIQCLARWMDHLGDAGFSRQIYHEVGWNRLERLRGLLEKSV